MVAGSPESPPIGREEGDGDRDLARLAPLDIVIAEVHDAAIASTMRTLAVDTPPRQQSLPQPAVNDAEMTEQEVVVELRGIRKSFGANEVLHGVDLAVQTGQHVVIFGPSGLCSPSAFAASFFSAEPAAPALAPAPSFFSSGLFSAFFNQ